MRSNSAMAFLASALPSTLAAYAGFNYGSTWTSGAAKTQDDFESLFKAAAGLIGAPIEFTSARIYTMVQGGTADDVISAIPAAISTNTTLLLGLWCSAGDESFANELNALKSAIDTYGTSLGSLVAGISVGSEDLYRISPQGVEAKSNPGAEPDVIVGYIKQVRDAISDTALANAPVGHVDTWTAWANGSNLDVANNCDFVGVDAYPYFQSTMTNDIDSGKSLFDSAMDQVEATVGDKDIWVTETGWPVSGDTSNLAVPSTEDAQTYWANVGCPMFGSTNVWWYTLQDADSSSTPSPSFGLVGSTLSSTPLYNLTCSAVSNTPSSSTNGTHSGNATATGVVSGSPGGVSSTQASIEATPLTSTATKATGTAAVGPDATSSSSSSGSTVEVNAAATVFAGPALGFAAGLAAILAL